MAIIKRTVLALTLAAAAINAQEITPIENGNLEGNGTF